MSILRVFSLDFFSISLDDNDVHVRVSAVFYKSKSQVDLVVVESLLLLLLFTVISLVELVINIELKYYWALSVFVDADAAAVVVEVVNHC